MESKDNLVEPKKKSTLEEKFETYNHQLDQTADWILSQMKQTDGNWTMPWHKGLPQAVNAKTGKFYGGNNQMILWKACVERGYSRNKWATFYQWSSVKAKLKRGEKGTLICIAIPKDKNSKKEQNQLLLFEKFNPDTFSKKNVYFNFRFKYVFNQSQVEGYFGDQPDIFNPDPDPDQLIQKLIKNSAADIREGGDIAFYTTSEDFIQMPELFRFKGDNIAKSKQLYYSTLLHEMIHWTGHHSRCKRKFGSEFGNPEYAFEELVAELGSALLSTHLGKKIYPRVEHAKYLNNWLRVLKNDFSYFYIAMDLAKYAIYWLFEKTDVYPYDLKKQEPKLPSEKFLDKLQSDWEC